MKMLKNNKAFTIIELIVVIAILGILVLLAAPKFIGYTQDAKMTQIKSDIKAYEVALGTELARDNQFIDNWTPISQSELDNLNSSEKVINKREEIVKDLNGENYIIKKEDVKVKSELDGDFIYTPSGEVVYYDKNISNIPGGGNTGGTTPPIDNGGNTGGTTPPIDNGGNTGGTTPPTPEPEKPVVMLTDADFTWVANSDGYYTEQYPTTKGFYQYIDSGEENIEIPHIIHGTPMTSYYRMFYNTGASVKKVVSTNPNIKSVNYMFWNSVATELDLSKFDTSNVENMMYMFYYAKTTKIDVSGFDTSKVTDMEAVFAGTEALTLDLSNFDTSNVTTMRSMFSHAKATDITFGPKFVTNNVQNMDYMFKLSQKSELDLSNFDTSNATTMRGMFEEVQTKSLDLSNFDTSNVVSMEHMFEGSKAETIIFGPKFVTSNVNDMDNMFQNSELSKIDVSFFDTRKVNTMYGMFGGSKAKNITFGPEFITSNVTNMTNMFKDAQAITLDLRTFDTSKLTNRGGMFQGAQATTGYARTQADADIFNTHTSKPDTLVFTVVNP